MGIGAVWARAAYRERVGRNYGLHDKSLAFYYS